jgi:hypothetical protein
LADQLVEAVVGAVVGDDRELAQLVPDGDAPAVQVARVGVLVDLVVEQGAVGQLGVESEGRAALGVEPKEPLPSGTTSAIAICTR